MFDVLADLLEQPLFFPLQLLHPGWCGKNESLENGSPRCQQMLMGEGKTTVIAPLLVLLLADTNR